MTDREAAKIIEVAQDYKEAQRRLASAELNLDLNTKAHKEAQVTHTNVKARLAYIVQRVSK